MMVRDDEMWLNEKLFARRGGKKRDLGLNMEEESTEGCQKKEDGKEEGGRYMSTHNVLLTESFLC